MSWSIVYEDEYLAAIDKPPGLLVAPDRWDKEILNLADWVRDQYSPEWRNVHRLDRDTSGVVLFAKSPELQSDFTALFETQSVTKIYSALDTPRSASAGRQDRYPLGCRPSPPGPHAGRGKRQTESHGLRDARNLSRRRLRAARRPSLDRPHASDPRSPRRHRRPRARRSLVRRRPTAPPVRRETAFSRRRTRSSLIARLALHARQLAFEHPVTHLPCVINAPWPADFERAVAALAATARRTTRA